MLLKLTTVVVAFLIWTPVANAWTWPVPGSVLQPFSYDEAHPYDAGQHRGIDIGASAAGDSVVAPADGTVSFAGFVPTSGESVTIETADGYSVTLTHLGSIGVTTGAAVSEGSVVGTVGPSGTPEQFVPYVHLGIRLTTDPLGYLDPLGLLPAPEAPKPAPTPTPTPVSKAVPVAKHSRGGGLVIEKPKPAAAPAAVAAPAEPAHITEPKERPGQKSDPAAPTVRTLRTDVPQIRLPIAEPIAESAPVVLTPYAPPTETEPLVLSIAPGIVAALLALVTAFTRSRRQARRSATVISFRREPPLRRAA